LPGFGCRFWDSLAGGRASFGAAGFLASFVRPEYHLLEDWVLSRVVFERGDELAEVAGRSEGVDGCGEASSLVEEVAVERRRELLLEVVHEGEVQDFFEQLGVALVVRVEVPCETRQSEQSPAVLRAALVELDHASRFGQQLVWV